MLPLAKKHHFRRTLQNQLMIFCAYLTSWEIHLFLWSMRQYLLLVAFKLLLWKYADLEVSSFYEYSRFKENEDMKELE